MIFFWNGLCGLEGDEYRELCGLEGETYRGLCGLEGDTYRGLLADRLDVEDDGHVGQLGADCVSAKKET